jgi:uridine kinase
LNVTKKEYFSEYEDNPKHGQPPFAPISHIGIAFKNGICPAKFLEKVDPSKKSFLNESFREMLTANTGEEIYYESLLHRATESVSPFSKDSNLFLSEDDIYCNFWDFENKRIHYCFVIGFSGSGKTNLARNLAKKYKAEWVSLDVLLYDSRVHRMTEKFVYGVQKQKLLAKYLKETNIDLSYMRDVVYKETPEARRVMVETGRKFVDWLIYKNKEPVIIEGLDLIDIIPTNPSLYSAPIVFKGTSRLVSMFRRIQREKFKTPLDTIIRMIQWYKSDAHGIDYIRSIVMGEYNTQHRKELGRYNHSKYYRKDY